MSRNNGGDRDAPRDGVRERGGDRFRDDQTPHQRRRGADNLVERTDPDRRANGSIDRRQSFSDGRDAARGSRSEQTRDWVESGSDNGEGKLVDSLKMNGNVPPDMKKQRRIGSIDRRVERPSPDDKNGGQVRERSTQNRDAEEHGGSARRSQIGRKGDCPTKTDDAKRKEEHKLRTSQRARAGDMEKDSNGRGQQRGRKIGYTSEHERSREPLAGHSRTTRGRNEDWAQGNNQPTGGKRSRSRVTDGQKLPVSGGVDGGSDWTGNGQRANGRVPVEEQQRGRRGTWTDLATTNGHRSGGNDEDIARISAHRERRCVENEDDDSESDEGEACDYVKGFMSHFSFHILFVITMRVVTGFVTARRRDVWSTNGIGRFDMSQKTTITSGLSALLAKHFAQGAGTLTR